MDFGPRVHRLSDHSHLDFPILMLFDVRCVAIVKIPVNGYQKGRGFLALPEKYPLNYADILTQYDCVYQNG